MAGNKDTPSGGDSEKYALWLKPENEVYDVLNRIIVSLSEEYDAPRFEPHITIAGDIRYPVKTLKELVGKAAEQSELMTLCLTDTDFRDTLYQSLFVHIAPNDALLALRERCLAELNLEHGPYMPHISLLYKQLENEEKRKIIERVGRRFDLVFVPDKLYLIRTSGRPESWEEIMHVPLIS